MSQVLTPLVYSVILHIEQDKSNAPGFFPGNFIRIRSIYMTVQKICPLREPIDHLGCCRL